MHHLWHFDQQHGECPKQQQIHGSDQYESGRSVYVLTPVFLSTKQSLQPHVLPICRVDCPSVVHLQRRRQEERRLLDWGVHLHLNGKDVRLTQVSTPLLDTKIGRSPTRVMPFSVRQPLVRSTVQRRKFARRCVCAFPFCVFLRCCQGFSIAITEGCWKVLPSINAKLFDETLEVSPVFNPVF